MGATAPWPAVSPTPITQVLLPAVPHEPSPTVPVATLNVVLKEPFLVTLSALARLTAQCGSSATLSCPVTEALHSSRKKEFFFPLVVTGRPLPVTTTTLPLLRFLAGVTLTLAVDAPAGAAPIASAPREATHMPPTRSPVNRPRRMVVAFPSNLTPPSGLGRHHSTRTLVRQATGLSGWSPPLG